MQWKRSPSAPPGSPPVRPERAHSESYSAVPYRSVTERSARDPGDRAWLRVSPTCVIRLDELEWRTTASGGPGGQHANTSDTRVEVRFPISTSPSLGPRQRARLLERLGPVARATASDHRSQARNRELALERLRTRLASALKIDPPRRATKPSRSAKQARLDAKRRHAQRKQDRRRPATDD
jgi:ribosome-associated protein